MIRILSLALVGGVALSMVNAANAGCDCSAPQTAVKAATPDASGEIAAQPAPQRYSYDPSTVQAPTRVYRSYSYSPNMGSMSRGYNSRAYSNGIRGANSKVLGIDQPFSRR